jgi:hypothetical protein
VRRVLAALRIFGHARQGTWRFQFARTFEHRAAGFDTDHSSPPPSSEASPLVPTLLF